MPLFSPFSPTRSLLCDSTMRCELQGSECDRLHHTAVRTSDPDLWEQYRRATGQTKACVKTATQVFLQEKLIPLRHSSKCGGHYEHTLHPAPLANSPMLTPWKRLNFSTSILLTLAQTINRELRDIFGPRETPGPQPVGTRVSPVYCQHLNSKKGCPQAWTTKLVVLTKWLSNSSSWTPCSHFYPHLRHQQLTVKWSCAVWMEGSPSHTHPQVRANRWGLKTIAPSHCCQPSTRSLSAWSTTN